MVKRKLLLLIGCLFSVFAALVAARSESVQQGEARFSWRFATGGQIRSRPAIAADGTVYAISEDGYLYALSPDGQLSWKYDLGWLPWDCLAVGPDGSIYAGLKNRDLVAVNPRGTMIWRVRLDGLFVGDPLVAADGTLFVGIAPGTLVAMSHLGRELWRITLPGSLAATPVMDGTGTIYLVASDRRLYSLTPWGEFKWSLPLQAALSAPAIAGDGTVVVGTADGQVIAVSPLGDVEWRHQAGAPVAGISIGPDQVIAATANGVLLGLSARGRKLWETDTQKRLDSPPLLRGAGLLAFANDGSLVMFHPPRGAAERLTVGTAGAAVLGRDGSVYLGGRDWVLYAFPGQPGTADTGAPWPQAGHDQEHSGRTPSAPPGGLEALLNTNPDYLYLQSLSGSGSYDQVAQFLAEVRARTAGGSLGKSTWYIVRLLEQLAGAGVIFPVYRNQKVINDFPDLRADAAALLAQVGTVGSRWTLLRVVNAEPDSYALSVEIRALGKLSSDPDGASVRAITAAFARYGVSPPDNRLAAATVDALDRINAYMGSLGDASGPETLFSIFRGPFFDQIREAALEAAQRKPPAVEPPSP
ncbi:MAG: PQQ-binding-like beta-propeller repeat protein [Spirochaetia bacterium]|jgi:outer membrane protein assembly factor BamB